MTEEKAVEAAAVVEVAAVAMPVEVSAKAIMFEWLETKLTGLYIGGVYVSKTDDQYLTLLVDAWAQNKAHTDAYVAEHKVTIGVARQMTKLTLPVKIEFDRANQCFGGLPRHALKTGSDVQLQAHGFTGPLAKTEAFLGSYLQMFRLKYQQGSEYAHHTYKKVTKEAPTVEQAAPAEDQEVQEATIVIPEGMKYSAECDETIEYFKNRKAAKDFASAQDGDWNITELAS